MAKPKKETLIYVTNYDELTDSEGIASSLEELNNEVYLEEGQEVGIYKLVAVKAVRRGLTLE